MKITNVNNEEELIAIYDDAGDRIGTALRGMAHRCGLWHRAVHCWVVRSEGFILFQKRSSYKKVCPCLFDVSCAGHRSLNGAWESETVPDCCERELAEELGLHLSYNADIRHVGMKVDILKSGTTLNREFCDVHFIINSTKPSGYRLDSDEVEGLVEISIEGGLQLFSGATSSVQADGIDLCPTSQVWTHISRRVSVADFVPHFDNYYYRVFISARRLLDGENHICV